MQRVKFFLIAGIWIAVLPYLGFPVLIKNILFSLTGLFFIYIAILLNSKLPKKKKGFENFSENGHHKDTEGDTGAAEKMNDMRFSISEEILLTEE